MKAIIFISVILSTAFAFAGTTKKVETKGRFPASSENGANFCALRPSKCLVIVNPTIEINKKQYKIGMSDSFAGTLKSICRSHGFDNYAAAELGAVRDNNPKDQYYDASMGGKDNNIVSSEWVNSGYISIMVCSPEDML